MDLIIPTYGRAREQFTYGALMGNGFHPILVVQAREAQFYSQRPHVTVLPPSITTIAPTRQYILENIGTDNAMVMLDDDLSFFKRRHDAPDKFKEMEGENDYVKMFADISEGLERYAHVGIASREGGNRNTESFVKNSRIMRVLGYRRDILNKLGLRFDEMEVMEDFHIALSLLEKGYENLICNDWCHNQAGSGKTGGCSHFRTRDLQAGNARRLAELHPGLVRVVEKTTKSAWGGGSRTDVVISWKRALNARIFSVLDK